MKAKIQYWEVSKEVKNFFDELEKCTNVKIKFKQKDRNQIITDIVELKWEEK